MTLQTIKPSEIREWIIRTDEPFRGIAETFVMANGRVAYTGNPGQTVAEYAETCGKAIRVVPDAEFFAMVDGYLDSRKTAPAPITAERYDEALNVLPPRRWHKAGRFEVFHVSERLQGDLVDWYALEFDFHGKPTGKHWTMVQSCYIKDADLLALLEGASNG